MSDHMIRSEGTEYDYDQPIGYLVVCDCGEQFDHVSPDGARAAHQHHADEERRARDEEIWPSHGARPV